MSKKHRRGLAGREGGPPASTRAAPIRGAAIAAALRLAPGDHRGSGERREGQGRGFDLRSGADLYSVAKSAPLLGLELFTFSGLIRKTQ